MAATDSDAAANVHATTADGDATISNATAAITRVSEAQGPCPYP